MSTEFRSIRRAGIVAALLAATAAPGAAFAGTLVGTVSDATGTRVLESAIVELVELGRSAEAGPDGGYRFTDVPAGTYTLRTTYAGSAAVGRSVTVPATGTVTLDLVVGTEDEGAILVVGQRANLASSIARQRAADGVETVLTRDAIGQFPDQNVAEAMRRAPGVNILNDQGEGRFVSVRGLDPNLNAASINGVRVPAPESDVRSVALDVIPSELIESIEIKKSLTPDMDADTIGASIEINTTSAFDRQRPFLAISAEGSYNDLNRKLSPKGSIDFSTRIGEDFGVAGGLSYYRRKFATDNIEADGWNETDGGIVFADTLEYRDYDVTRERIGASLAFDWRASDTTSLFLRGLYSRFEDQEFRRRLIFEMDEEPASGDANSATFTSDDGRIQVERDSKDRLETQKILSLSAGGETEAGPWTFEYSGAYSKADETENGSLDPVNFRRRFEDAGELGVTFDYGDLEMPRYRIDFGGDAFLDPTEYEFDKIDRTTLSLADDEEYSGKFDITRSFALDQGTFDIQFGGKARFRDKSFDLELDVFDEFDGDFTLADVLGRQTYGLANIEPIADPFAIRDFVGGNIGRFGINAFDTLFDSSVEDFAVEEDILAGYLLGRYDSGALRLIGGVRVEHTRNDVSANLVEVVEEGGVRDGVELDEDTIFLSRNRFRQDYTDWLPSVNLRYEATPELLLRFGGYRSVVRPNIADLAPRFAVEENDDGEREGEFGNPDLEPYEAWNLDLSAEYYFARNAVIQAGLFYKTIDNFIVDAEFNDGSFNGIDFDQAIIPINGEEAEVKGLEFSYQQALTFLPAPLDGLLVNLNYTFTDADGEVNGRTIPLPASSRHTLNAIVGYEKGPVSLRFAGAYRSGYLDELGDNEEEDRFVRKHFQFDVSAKYRVTPNVQLFAELVNAFDEPYVAFQRGPRANRLLQYEEYSWTGKFGVRANF